MCRQSSLTLKLSVKQDVDDSLWQSTTIDNTSNSVSMIAIAVRHQIKTKGQCFTFLSNGKKYLVQSKRLTGKDYSNPLIAVDLLKIQTRAEVVKLQTPARG